MMGAPCQLSTSFTNHRTKKKVKVNIFILWSDFSEKKEKLLIKQEKTSDSTKMAKAGSVIHISSEEQFRGEINAAKEAKKIVAVDFFATWCGPCRAVAPVFEQLSERYPAVVFLKVDVDALEEVARQYEVNAMPTFLFLKDGEEMDRFVGANPAQLEAKLAHHAAAP